MCFSLCFARRNEEILQSLSMLWRQRHLEHRQEEAQQQSLERRASAPLYTAGDENILGRRGSSAFRARAYKTVRHRGKST